LGLLKAVYSLAVDTLKYLHPAVVT